MILPNDESIEIKILGILLDKKNTTTSYKLFWFWGMLKEIIQGNQNIYFRKIVNRMIANAWYPILEYHLNFGISDKLKDIVTEIHEKYEISNNEKEENILLFLDKIEEKSIEKKISYFYKYVPYRLISPFYIKELAKMQDGKKNKKIVELSQSSEIALYKIDDNNKSISINNKWFNYIFKNQSIIEGWLKYKLIAYLQSRNPNVPAIPFKLTPSNQRNLKHAKKYWKKIIKISPMIDIYTNKYLYNKNFEIYGEMSIDHFIPWSFVNHDEMWNLIPTFKRINSSKSDKLPSLKDNLEKFCELQYKSFIIAKKYNIENKYLQEYLTINKKIDISNKHYEIIEKRVFNESLKDTIIPLYQIAKNQGYSIWRK